MALEASCDGVSGEAPAGAGAKEGIVGGPLAFLEPYAQHCCGCRAERHGALFAAFAFASEVRACVEVDVGLVEGGELGDTQSGVHGEIDEGVISACFPCAPVRRCDERFDLVVVKERDGLGVGEFLGDGQDSLDDRCVFGVMKSA